MPTSGDCSSTATSPYASDCRTANQSAPFFIAAMQRYNLIHPGQIAAVLALTGFESVDLKYKHNVYPGRPGQGTSAMLMPPNVLAYVESIPQLAGDLETTGGDPVKILEIVTEDEWNFGAAAWYVTNNEGCKKLGVAEALISASDVAWATYMQCVGVDQNDQDRLAYWERAKGAFGLPLATDPPKMK
ncbi:hypothetical protein GE09DRAFT_1178703 [Coniochaeta sp. 2T2.1]|nr:hypothetical protein GE09DRAFT_1178703 [Coniochaeta sp. 2T2.1]